MFEIHDTQGGITFAIKVIPNASSSQIVGLIGDRVKVRVSAPPENGKANIAVCTILAKALGVRVKDVSVISGHSNAMKTIAVSHLTCKAARLKLPH